MGRQTRPGNIEIDPLVSRSALRSVGRRETSTTVLERPKTRKRSATSLRREIRNRLNIIDDADSLRTILRLVIKMEPEMPEELVRMLEEGDRDIAEGRVHSNEEMIKWFEERKRKQ